MHVGEVKVDTNMVIRAVVFDIGGVLQITQEMDFARWEARLGLPPGAIYQPLFDVWTAGSIGTITEEALYETTSDRLGIAREHIDAMMADMWKRYLGTANTELIQYARALRPRYRTGILSNSFVGARERQQEAYGFEDLVDDIVYSHEVGLSKPDPRIYALICARLDACPAEMVFLDDAECCVAGAREAGIQAIHYRNNAQAIAEIEAVLLMGSGIQDRRAGGESR